MSEVQRDTGQKKIIVTLRYDKYDDSAFIMYVIQLFINDFIRNHFLQRNYSKKTYSRGNSNWSEQKVLGIANVTSTFSNTNSLVENVVLVITLIHIHLW